MKKGIFVAGTDTDVGKTMFCALLLRHLIEKGIRGIYFKPVSTGCIEDESGLISEDLLFVSQVCGTKLDRKLNTPIMFRTPASPLHACRAENGGINFDLIRSSYNFLISSFEYVIVEGIGGVMVPLTSNYYLVDLIKEFDIPTIILTRPGLGTINHTILTIDKIKSKSIDIVGFITNGAADDTDPTINTNPSIIEELTGITYIGHIPHMASLNTRQPGWDQVTRVLNQVYNIAVVPKEGAYEEDPHSRRQQVLLKAPKTRD